MVALLDPKRLPKDTPSRGVIVFLYTPRERDDGQEPYDFIVYDQKQSYTVEELCIELGKRLKIKPAALPLFALASLEHDNYWPALSRVLRTDTATKYVLRIRYRVPHPNKVRQLWEYNADTIVYLFWQIVNDLMVGRIEGLEEKQILGYSGLALFGSIKCEEKADFTRFVPHSLKKQYQRLDRKYQLKNQMRECYNLIKGDYVKRENPKLDALRSMVLDLLKTSDTYLNETYQVQEQHGGSSSTLTVTNENVTFHKSDGKPKNYHTYEFNEVYSYDDILHCVGKTEIKFILSLRRDPPKFLVASTSHHMESILGAIDGYHRLVINYYHLLNVLHTGQKVGPPSLVELKTLRCHGPLTKVVSKELLRGKEVGDYILKQHPDEIGNYVVTLNYGSPPTPKSVLITRTGDNKKYVCGMFEDRTFGSVKEVLETLARAKVNLRSQILNRDETSLLICRPEDIPTEDEEQVSTSSQMSESGVRCVSGKTIVDLELISKGYFTEVRHAKFQHRDVAVKQLINTPEAYRNGDLMEALQTGIYKASLWSDPTIVHVEALCLSPPFRAIMEHSPYGSLDAYLQNCHRLVYTMDVLHVMYELAMAIGYLQSLHDYHGNIRCRNLLVFNEYPEVKCKLADPGVASLYNRARPDHDLCIERSKWVAPEILNNAVEPSAQSDIYSFGITFVELFHHVKREPFLTSMSSDPLETKPDNCLPQIWELIQQCCAEPMDRKTQKDILRDVWQMIVSMDPDGGCYYPTQLDVSPTSQKTDYYTNTDTSVGQRSRIHNQVLNAKHLPQHATNGSALNAAENGSALPAIPPLPNTMPPTRVCASPDSSAGTLESRTCQSGVSMFSYGSVNSTTPLIPPCASGQTIRSTLSDLNLSLEDSAPFRRSATITPSTSAESMTNSQQPLIPRERNLSTRSNPPPLPAKQHPMEQTNQAFSGDSIPAMQETVQQLMPAQSPRPALSSQSSQSVLPMSSINIPSIPKSHLRLNQEKLGSGHYGVVMKAFLRAEDGGEEREVAVKRLQQQFTPTEDQELEFRKEIAIMAELDHPNIVKIIGMCVNEGKRRRLWLIMEFVEKGSLKSFVQKQHIQALHLLHYCLDIAEGMLYLSENNIVHRDLAARNILVTARCRMKISDFGLARQLQDRNYYLSESNRELPALWCALEGLEFNRFSTKGDVWSFGVTMWEVFSHGKKPSLDENIRVMYQMLKDGHRLPKPESCPQEVYEKVMYPCWEKDSTKRAGFSTIKSTLNTIIEQLPLAD